MKKSFIWLVFIIISLSIYSNEMFSDDFNNEILSSAWTIYEEGEGGKYEFFDGINGLIVDGIKISIEKTHDYNKSSFGFYKQIPSIISNEFAGSGAELKVSLPDYNIIEQDDFYGPFILNITFNNGDIIKYVFKTIDKYTLVINTFEYYYNDVLIDDSLYIWVPLGTKITEDNIMYPILKHNPVADLKLVGLGDNEYQWRDGKSINISGFPKSAMLSVEYQRFPGANGENNLYYCVDYIISNPDINDFFTADIDRNTLIVNYDNDINIILRDLYANIPFDGDAIITLNTPSGTIDKYWNSETEYISFDNISPNSLNDNYEISITSLETSQCEDIGLQIIEDELESDTPDNTPVLNENELTITVMGKYKNETIPNVNVTAYSNSMDYYYESQTNSNGEVFLPGYFQSTEDINLTFEKDDYIGEQSVIHPFLYSSISNAMGLNNQDNITYNSDLQQYNMIYSDGNNIIIAQRPINRDYWDVEKIGEGTLPVLVKTNDGLIAMWEDLQYSVMSSPWSPVDTVYPQILTVSEPILKSAALDNGKYGSYIGYRTNQPINGDLIIGLWDDYDIENVILDTVMKMDGSAGATPQCSPLVAGYIDFPNESYLAGCIDMDNRVAYSLWDFDIERWLLAEFADNEGQYCLNPSIDFNGYNTTFVWEVDNGDNTKDIWERKITPYGIEEAKKISVTEGINRYAKNRDNELYTYVNNDNTLIDYRDGYSDSLNPITYTLYEGNDSLHSYSVNVRPVKMNTEALYAITEGSNGNYRINFINKTYENWMPRALTVVPADTLIINAQQSPISNYVNGSFPVERMSVDIPIVDNGLTDMIELTTDDKNPHIPQVVMIDGEVMGVIFGGNEEKITQIDVPSYMRDDNVITVTVDRMKGNPNRTTEIALYEYETEDAQTVNNNQIAFKPQTSNSDLQTSMAINSTLSTIDLKYSIPQSGYVNLRIFDISGRVVETVQSGQLSKGMYSYNTKQTRSGVYFAVMEYNNKVYKEKFIIVK